MTEALLNNILQTANQDFAGPKRKNRTDYRDSGRSFTETMQEIREKQQRTKKSTIKSSSTEKKEGSSLDNQEFLAKLKEILSKNKKEIPSELLSLLEGGSLNGQQKAMLEKLMLNLKNNNLDISKLKSLLEKNSNQLRAENSEQLQFLNQKAEGGELELKSLNTEQLEKLASLLENEEQNLSQAESSKLKAELDQLAKMLINSNSGSGKKAEQNLEQLLAAEDLQLKLSELSSALKEVNFSSEDFAEITEQQGVKLPLLTQVLASETLNFSELNKTLNSDNNSSISAEFVAQLKEMLNEENAKVNNQETNSNLDLNSSDIFSLNNDSALDLVFQGGELESKNQNEFFDLNNSNPLFNFDLESQTSANNLNLESFSLNGENTANLAENADLRAQVAEQFRGEYSPETKEMQIQLKPESLGKIDISLSYDNEQLTGKMLVESEIVRAQLENSLKGLKSDLLKQGINIEQFKIETAKNAPQQVEKQNDFAFDDQDAAFSDGETGQNQEYEQRQFFQGRYYVQRNNGSSNLDSENIIMRQQEIINRAAFSNEKLNLLA